MTWRMRVHQGCISHGHLQYLTMRSMGHSVRVHHGCISYGVCILQGMICNIRYACVVLWVQASSEDPGWRDSSVEAASRLLAAGEYDSAMEVRLE
jgi:hypothetical protein